MKALLYSHYVDETAILSLIIQQAGFSVRVVRNLDKAIEEWPENPLDLALISLVEEPAKILSYVKMLRTPSTSPIIMISQNLSEETWVNLLEAGVDLVVERPYSVRVLQAQVRSLMRRSANIPFFSLPSLTRGNITLDTEKRFVRVGKGAAVHLTQLEFRLLYTLMTHEGQIIPTESLVEYVWGYAGQVNNALVRGLVQRLRTKIEPNPSRPNFIQNESGVGYFFQTQPETGD